MSDYYIPASKVRELRATVEQLMAENLKKQTASDMSCLNCEIMKSFEDALQEEVYIESPQSNSSHNRTFYTARRVLDFPRRSRC